MDYLRNLTLWFWRPKRLMDRFLYILEAHKTNAISDTGIKEKNKKLTVCDWKSYVNNDI